MTKFEVTDAMLNAAEQAYDTIAAIEHDAWCYTAPTRAAITAAIEASGLVEENARLRAENRELRIFATDIVNKRWDFFYPIEKAVETASFDFFKHVNSKFKALNKESTNDQ
ncbi:MAG: hypothetical protein ACOVN5_08570 [Aquidulcibacter sp.]